MKYFHTFFLALLAVVFLSSVQSYAGGKTIVDGIMLISHTTETPTIDGVMDRVWDATTATLLYKYEGGPEDSAGVFSNHYSTVRCLWDEDYFYFFASVVDQERDGSWKSEPWLNDCFELFFDGENEKASSYDTNDVQWRWIYGEVVGDTANAGNGPGEWAWLDTDNGYNLELRISTSDLAAIMPLELDHEFGFEVSNADRDNGQRNNVLHWWTTDGNTWQYPNLFGTALLSGREATEVITVPLSQDGIDLNGVMDVGEWDVSDELSLERFEGTTRPDTILPNWKTHFSSYYTMWDANYFYAFVKVVDDELDGSWQSEPWLNDCVEIFFDGENEKASSYDTNDVQWRWVYGETVGDTTNVGNGPGEWAWAVTGNGYNLELKISTADLEAIMPLENDHEFGFEISNANRKDGNRLDVRHWWTNDGNTWQYPNLFGTAILSFGPQGITPIPGVVEDYKLEQNYPNPFNPSTKIIYAIANPGFVNITVYDIIGREVAVLVNESQVTGKYEVDFNASKLSSGIYFYKLTTDNRAIVKKMMLLK